jgi:transcriptional regulator with XRE-family HTH domain
MKELCKRIKAAKKHGITRLTIADRIGVSYDYLNRYLGGFKKPMPEHIRLAIEEILKEVE